MMTELQQRLLMRIDYAFAGVELDDGVSLGETQVIDDYGTDEERRAVRERDESHDWHKLIDDPRLPVLLGLGYGGLCFFDALGLRFHLPACLTLLVRDPHDDRNSSLFESLLYRVSDLSEYTQGQFAALDRTQRNCVRDVLLYWHDAEMIHEGESVWMLGEAHRELLADVIRDYWSQPDGRRT